MTLVDEHRQFFKSCVGLPEPWASRRESPLSYSFCRQAVLCDAPLIVRDAQTDERVKDNPAVVEFGVRAYAGNPIRTRSGEVLGSFCVFDSGPRDWSETELEILSELASSVESEIELVTLAAREREQHQLLKVIIEKSPLAISVIDDDARVLLWNKAAEEMFDYRSDEVLGKPLPIVPPDKEDECRSVRKQLTEGQTFQGISTYRCRRDKSKVHVKIAAAQLQEFEGEAGRCLLIFDDVSEQIRADREREQLLQQLQEESSLTNAVLDQLPAGVIVADAPSGQILSVNERAYELLGNQVSDKVDLNALAAYVGYHPDGRRYEPDEWPLARTILHGESISNEDILFETSDGSRRRLLASSKLVEFGHRNQARAITTFTDVTELKALEAARHRSEEQARQILASSHDSIKILDLDGRLLSMNRMGAKLHEIDDVEALLGSAWTDFWQGSNRIAAAAAIEAARAGRLGRFRGVRATRKSNIKTWWDVVVTPITGEDGRPEQLLAISRDVTESVDAEEEREALIKREVQARQDAETAREKYRNLVDGLDAIVWEADANTWKFNFVSERAEQILGYPIEQWLSDPAFWPSIIHPDDRDSSVTLCRNACRDCRDHDFEYRAITRDGRSVWLRDIVYVVPDDAGKPHHLRGVMVDITAKKELEQELRERAEQLSEMDARKNEFLAVLAHELRNPLAPISNAAELLPSFSDDPKEIAEISDILQGQVSQLVRLIDDLMDVSRITRGKIKLQQEPVSIVEVLETSLASVRPACKSRQHELRWDIEPASGLIVEGDRVRLAQVFTNILNNACKYTPGGGTIELHCNAVGGAVEISIEDNGIGISQKDASGIFEMFTQVESSVTRSQGGLGIGLTLVKQLVEMHDGSVVLDQDRKGPGSRFVVRLPLAQANQIEHQPSSYSSDSESLKVVVIDDLRAVATMFVKLVEALGHEARMALSADEGIKMTRAYKPDVVFSDICMPDSSGYEVAQSLRALPELRDLTIIAMTGNGQPEDIQQAYEAGFDRHLVKPASIQILRQVFDEITATDTLGNQVNVEK
ncbi:multi-sensor hybrid histidine kinase [Rhodopirellula maiorica SM1]|uniref:histidine kinase n=1 Tax=Rhodopirellula maiorica SM1 TaxID=1265738 RepID=M5S8K0_9BACT|nr:multi-sensor hybrid histidine kinase [Rhodopirellula maiorica SM1]